MTTKTLISGAGVAGQTLAYFLNRDGHDVTVVERSPEVRAGGYAVDFRGAAFDVLAELGILAEVRLHDTQMRGTTLLDPTGAELAELPAEDFAGELEVPKTDLARILHGITAGEVDYLFGDTITALRQGDTGVEVTFEHAPAATYDLVVGADGVHSRVRRLAFGRHSDAIRHLGMSGTGFSAPNFLGLKRKGVLCTSPGAAIYLFSAGDAARMTVSLSFGTAAPTLDRVSRAEQEQAVQAAFEGHGWEETPRLLAAMAEADDFYFVSSCQVQLESWSYGRVVLVGDAGYCAAPTSGMGTSQALLAARELARQLTNAGHTAAFDAYEQALRPYVTENQKRGRQAAARFGALSQ